MSSLEEFISNSMPLGTLIGSKQLSIPGGAGKLEDFTVNVKVEEKISSGTKSNELIYGTISIDNNQQANEDASIFLTIAGLDSMSLVLSPECSKIVDPDINSNRIQVNLSECSHKLIHYSIKEKTEDPFLKYKYTVISKPNQIYRVEVTIEMKNATSMRFSYFNIQFKLPFINDLTAIINSTMNCGHLQFEKSGGLFWFIKTKFPKSGRILLSFETVSSEEETCFDAICNFKLENFNYGIPKLTNGSIIANEFVPHNYKLITEFIFYSFDYRLIPTYK